MKVIENRLWSHLSIHTHEKHANKEIKSSDALTVSSFQELVKHVAQIAFHNPEFSLFFRGQDGDYRDKGGNTALYPSIFRANSSAYILRKKDLAKRFEILRRGEDLLLDRFHLYGKHKLSKFKEMSWAILQHYEVCPTPLLDITASLRVACSFALHGDKGVGNVFILGVPHVNGSISYFTDVEMLNIKLLGICPPNAYRPFFQEGYLVGSFPITEQRHSSLNFSRRMIAKFRIEKEGFWDETFPPMPLAALYPDEEDEVKDICDEVKQELRQ
jgi:hypothetical protein